MKNLFIILTLLFCVSSLNAVNCECGEHSTGITYYSVNGDDCCTSLTTGSAYFSEYELQDNGVWVRMSTTVLSASYAQSECCDD